MHTIGTQPHPHKKTDRLVTQWVGGKSWDLPGAGVACVTKFSAKRHAVVISTVKACAWRR